MNFDRILSLLRNPAGFTADELRTARLIAADIIESLPQQVATMERVALDDGDILVVHVPDQLTADRMHAIKSYIEAIPPFAGHECVVMAGGMRLSVLSPPSTTKETTIDTTTLRSDGLLPCPCLTYEPCQKRGVGSGYRCRREAMAASERDSEL